MKNNIILIIFYILIFSFLFFSFSLLCNAQVKTLTKINLNENEKIYNIYTDSLQKNYAVVITSVNEGMISTFTEYYILTKSGKLGPFEDVFDISFFDNGSQMLASVKKDGKYYVYLNQNISGPYDSVSRFYTIFASKSFAYWVKENEKIYVIYMDKKLGPYAEITSFIADQKSQKIVWNAKTDKYELLVNGTSTFKADKIVLFGFYTDKRILCYAAGKSGAYYLVVGSTNYGPYENIGLDLAVKDENLASFFAKIDGKWYLVAGKEKAGPFDSTGFVAISPDGKKIAYAAYKEYDGWSIYLGAKLIKSVDASYFAFLDFVKVDATNYDIVYLVGDDYEDYYEWSIYIGTNDEPVYSYYLDTDSPYIGSLNLSYYGVDFLMDMNGTFSFLECYDYEYFIGIFSLKDMSYGTFGPAEEYETTYVIDVANNVVFFVLDGEYYIGIPFTNQEDNYPGFKTNGRIVYGLDGSKIGVVYYDSKNGTICYVDLNNVIAAISSIFN